MIKILVIGDLHGELPKLYVTNFDAIISPGDIYGDDIRPYIKKYLKEATKKGKENVYFEDFISEKEQKKLEKISLEKGRKVLKYLNSFGKPVFLVPGNWNPTDAKFGQLKPEKNYWREDIKKFKNIVDVDMKKRKFKGLNIIGYGISSSPEPLDKPEKEEFNNISEYKEKLKQHKYFTKRREKLKKIFEDVQSHTIFISHNSPHKTKLDKVYAPGTYAHNKNYGSVIGREIIDEYQPLLCICGHIHEGYGKTKIKKTLSINSGYGGEVNTFLEIDEKTGKVLSAEFLGKNKEN